VAEGPLQRKAGGDIRLRPASLAGRLKTKKTKGLKAHFYLEIDLFKHLMDIIRETLTYKKNTLHVCLSELTRQEQYEFVRLLLATRTSGVTLCDCQPNQYILRVLARLGIPRTRCLRVS
jgi:DNA-binding LacI/PurR family transcriptional regulator